MKKSTIVLSVLTHAPSRLCVKLASPYMRKSREVIRYSQSLADACVVDVDVEDRNVSALKFFLEDSHEYERAKRVVGVIYCAYADVSLLNFISTCENGMQAFWQYMRNPNVVSTWTFKPYGQIDVLEFEKAVISVSHQGVLNCENLLRSYLTMLHHCEHDLDGAIKQILLEDQRFWLARTLYRESVEFPVSLYEEKLKKTWHKLEQRYNNCSH